jgi:uncharacterized protein (DUF362 family)
MAVARGADRAVTLQRGLAAMGGLDRFVKPGDRVLLKVNAGFAVPAWLGATADPGLVADLARRCLAVGAASVVVTDNPVNDPESTFRVSGIAEAAEGAGARLILPREGMFRPVTLPGAELIRDWPVLTGPFDGVTKVINVCPVKDHVRSIATMSLKNWYGLLGGRRNLFHQRINDIVKELSVLVRPTLVVLDGTVTMIANGPTGGSVDDLKRTDTLILSTDPVAADAFGATLLGRTPADLPYLAKAAALGAGTVDWASLGVVRVGTEG